MLCKSAAAAGVQRMRIPYERSILLKEGIHFGFFKELAPIGLGKPFAHGCPKTGFISKHAQGCLLNQPFRVYPGMASDLR